MSASIPLMRPWPLLLLIAGVIFSDVLHAQTSAVEIPENPPRDYLFHAGGGNIAFNESQAGAISADLRAFAKDTGFPVYVVTVNSPPAEVMANLQQQVSVKWKGTRDCLVIFYDLDTLMLAVDFEHFHQGPDGMMEPSRLLGISEDAWVRYVDQWLEGHRQSDGLEIPFSSAFFRDFLDFMRQQLHEKQRSQPISRAWLVGIGIALLLAMGVFVWLLKFTRRFTADVEYHFPMLRMEHRLKARFGGGLLSVRQMGGNRPPR